MNLSVEALAERVNVWCSKRRLKPANGQVADAVSVRTLRYYRTMGLLDAPTSGGGEGYGERHFLQACAVKVLQAEGLPQSRIHSLLFGRSEKELQEVLDHATAALTTASRHVTTAAPASPQTWQVTPLSDDFLLVRQRPGAALTKTQLEAIQDILAHPAPPAHSQTLSTQRKIKPVS